jgi:signal transduction histidine kinase
VPVALCLLGQVVVRATYGLKAADALPVMPVDPIVLTFNFTGITYALALFRFRLFHLVPIARGTVIDQMREGMFVLDGNGRIMDLNPAAEKILGVSAANARGACLAGFLPSWNQGQSEITLDAGKAIMHFAVHGSALSDRRGLQVGRLVLLYDVTGQKQAQAKVVEQQRALATLQERDRVAKELHDTLGQVLGYIKMQAEVALTFLERDAPSEAKRRMARLAAAAQDAQGDVREYILAARTGIAANDNFLVTLEKYLQCFSNIHGIAAKLDVSSELAKAAFEPMVEAQLLRIIQEALSNVRKHARATGVDIRISASDGHAETIIQDDGIGFDPTLVESDLGQKYGLRLMRERAREVGGAVQIHATPGAGTRVVVSVPLRS